MRICGVTGGEPRARRLLVDRLVEHFGREGRVARVSRGDVEPTDDPGDRSHAVTAAYTLDADGTWSGTGREGSLDSLLADLAPDYDTVVVSGFPTADVPHVVLDGADHDGQTLLAAETAEAVDPALVADALAGTEPYETLESLVAQVERAENADRAGAIATFTGRVRERDHDEDAPTTHLEFEKYEGIAEERLTVLEDDLEAREGVFAVRLHHRTGVIESGEDIVFVVALAGHRDEAFQTARDGIDRLKEEVPIFKKEITAEETFWVHDRQ